MLDKTFRPAEVETKHYALWEASGAFAADPSSAATPFVVMMPPPNVTGSLHMGHALNHTLQDVLIRYHRMRGFDALWQPGTDHAGIATQMVVERQLAALGIGLARPGAETSVQGRLLDRATFIERVWEWRAQSGGTIIRQLRRLGVSADWARERFTMDDDLSRAVLKVFVDLYRQGLIYRDKRLVNWDPKLHTAISDLEVDSRDEKGHLWHLRYPVDGIDNRYIVVATTRPETMLGDTAVAVHPDDARYAALVGKHVVLPLVGRKIPIVADSYADPETGSGAVKITPAHDFSDFEVGRRHGLRAINIFDADARLNENAPPAYRGLDRYAARGRVVADLEARGLVERVEEHMLKLPYGDRSGVVIEPWLTDQWYVDAATLAAPAVASVEKGQVRFVPDQWAKTFFDWMRKIQPWCISRQIWWGHQIPAWYGPDGTVFVELSEPEADVAAARHYGKTVPIRRDPDVLDTWFSSALWPFSTIGWPTESPELKRYYPSSVLVTGFDIIFFWVARMMMMGLHFMRDVPFHDIYIHGLIRDERGQKMSKSKGNSIDPLELIDKFGADALRFTLAALATPGRDVKIAESRVEGHRNFATKLWNAARFCEMNGCALQADFDPANCRQQVNRWIVSSLADSASRIERAVETYRFDEMASALYQFVWHEFCDWYLEFVKPVLASADPAAKLETQATAAWVLGRLLHLLHPLMPFLTEELWEQIGGRQQAPIGQSGRLITAEWPILPGSMIDAAAADELGWVIRLISEIRAVRSELNVPPATRMPLLIHDAGELAQSRLAAHKESISRMARVDRLGTTSATPPKGAVQIVLDGATIVLPLAGIIDIEQERTRLAKEVAKAEFEIARIEGKLGNQQFIAKAPREVVEEQRERVAEANRLRARLAAALDRMSGI